MESEIWKPIKGYEGLYEISNKLLVRKKTSGYILSLNKSNQVTLFKGNSRKSISVKTLYQNSFLGIIKIGNSRIVKQKDVISVVSQRDIVANAKSNDKRKVCRLLGVSLNTSKGKKYQSCITINKKNIHLGYFNTENEAHKMYLKACKYEHLYKDVPKLFREILKNIKQ